MQFHAFGSFYSSMTADFLTFSWEVGRQNPNLFGILFLLEPPQKVRTRIPYVGNLNEPVFELLIGSNSYLYVFIVNLLFYLKRKCGISGCLGNLDMQPAWLGFGRQEAGF